MVGKCGKQGCHSCKESLFQFGAAFLRELRSVCTLSLRVHVFATTVLGLVRLDGL